MPIATETKEIKDGDQVKQILTVSFSNGALTQLELLKKFLGTDDPVEVIKVGIAMVQRAKENSNDECSKVKSENDGKSQ